MSEQEMRARLAQVIDDIDAGRVRPVNGAGRYLGSTVLVATMSLSGCAKDGSVEPLPPPDQTATATADPLPEPVAEYAAVDPGPVPEYAAVMATADRSATTATSATGTPTAEPTAKATAQATATTKDVPTATRTIRHPPLPYMAPDA